MTRVLLVTGARSLAAIPGAEAWARGHIRAALEGVGLLIVGDAPGPDAWAWKDALYAGCEGFMYCADGFQRGHFVHVRSRGVRLAGGVWADHAAKARSRERNAAMVRHAAAMRDDGADVRCLALLDGLKVDGDDKRATRGTEHTVGLAERAGLTVRREVWRP